MIETNSVHSSIHIGLPKKKNSIWYNVLASLVCLLLWAAINGVLFYCGNYTVLVATLSLLALWDIIRLQRALFKIFSR